MVRSISAAELIGRRRELTTIGDALAESERGNAQFSCLVGEAGVGKTRLLAAAADMARAREARVLRGTCIAAGRTMPFLPMLESLGVLASDSNGPEVPRQLLGSVLMPGSAHAPDAFDDHAERGRLLEGIAVLLDAAPGLTALVIDDIQWADAATLACLEYLTQRLRSTSFMLLAACRDGPELLPLVADGRRLTRLDVPPLTEDEVAEQAAAIKGGPVPRRAIERLLARSGGNPFVVEELLACDDADAIPASLDALLGARLEGISAHARELLEVLALLDRPAPSPLLRDVLSARPEVGRDELVHLGVADAGPDGLWLRHPLYGELVRRRMESTDRRAVHDRLADALAANGGVVTEIAHHRWESGHAVKALPAVIAAATTAEQLYAFEEAAIQLDRAVELATRLGAADLDPAQVTALHDRAAHAHWLAGDSSGAVDHVKSAMEADGSEEVASPRAYWLAVFAWDAGDTELSVRSFAQVAAADVADASTIQRSRAAFARARLAAARRAFDVAVSCGREAAALAASVSAAVDESSAFHVTGVALTSIGELDAGVASLRRGLDLGREAGSPWRIGMGYVHLAAVLQLCGRLEETVEMAEEGVRAVEEHGVGPAHVLDLQARAADALIELGEWERADRLTAPAVDGRSRAVQHLVRATLELRRGDLEAAGHQLEAASRTEGEHAAGGPGAFTSTVALRRLELATLRGDESAVSAHVEALRLVPNATTWEQVAAIEGELICSRAGGSRRGRPPGPPGDACEPACPSGAFGETLHLELAAERARLNGGASPERWGDIADAWASQSMIHRAAVARVREAEAALRRRGGRPLAAARLEEVLALAATIGAAPLAAWALDVRERSGMASDPSARTSSAAAGKAGLTTREVEVLAQLAQGKTNRQIAEELFISAKTVDVHVTRILGKLGAHTRGEAVAVATHRGMLR